MNRKLISGLVFLSMLGGTGLALYGTRVPYQYSYQGTITDKMQTYSNRFISSLGDTWFQSVSSGSWMKIDIFSSEAVSLTIEGSVSGQVYGTTGKFITTTVNFSSTERILVKTEAVVNYVYASGTFTFQHTGILSETRYKLEAIYLLLGGVLLCGGIGLIVYGGGRRW
ncbi:MAG: hypothetical protein V1850_07795 [Candidatus Bathyarchaeota archaeon]